MNDTLPSIDRRPLPMDLESEFVVHPTREILNNIPKVPPIVEVPKIDFGISGGDDLGFNQVSAQLSEMIKSSIGVSRERSQAAYNSDLTRQAEVGPDYGAKMKQRDETAMSNRDSRNTAIDQAESELSAKVELLHGLPQKIESARLELDDEIMRADSDRQHALINYARNADGRTKVGREYKAHLRVQSEADDELTKVENGVIESAKVLGFQMPVDVDSGFNRTKVLLYVKSLSQDDIDAALTSKRSQLEADKAQALKIYKSENDDSVRHYQELLDELDSHASKVSSSKTLLEESVSGYLAKTEDARFELYKNLIKISSDAADGSELAQIRDAYFDKVIDASSKYRSFTNSVDSALSTFGIRLNHNDVLQASEARRSMGGGEQESVELRLPEAPATPDFTDVPLPPEPVPTSLPNFAEGVDLPPEAAPAAAEVSPLPDGFWDSPIDLNTLTPTQADFLLFSGNLTADQIVKVSRAQASLDSVAHDALSAKAIQGKTEREAREAGYVVPEAAPAAPVAEPPPTSMDQAMVDAVFAGDKPKFGELNQEQLAYLLDSNLMTSEQSAAYANYVGAMTEAEFNDHRRKLETGRSNNRAAREIAGIDVGGGASPEEPLLAASPIETPAPAAEAAPAPTASERRGSRFSPTNLLRGLASSIKLQFTLASDPETGSSDKWDAAAWAFGAGTVTAAQLSGIPFASTIGKLGLNALAVGISALTPRILNYSEGADRLSVRVGGMTEASAEDRARERAAKFGRTNRVLLNASRGAAAASLVFGIYNLADLATGGALSAGIQEAGKSISDAVGSAVHSASETTSGWWGAVMNRFAGGADTAGHLQGHAETAVKAVKEVVAPTPTGIIESQTGSGFANMDVLRNFPNFHEWADVAPGQPTHSQMVGALVRGIWNSQHAGQTLPPFNPNLPVPEQIGLLDLSSLDATQQAALDALLKAGSREEYLSGPARELFNQFVFRTK